MRKILVAVMLAAAISPALAHGPGGYRGGYYPAPHYYPRSGWSWVAPAVIGGAVVYAATRPVYIVPGPPPPVVVQNLPPAPLGYHYEQVLDANCNCYRWVISPD